MPEGVPATCGQAPSEGSVRPHGTAERMAAQAAFDGYVAAFVAWARDVRGLSPNTVRAYETDLVAFAEWARREGIDPVHVEHRELRRWLAELAEAGYATSTVNRHLSSVRSLWRWLVREGICDEGAAAAVASPRMGRHLPRTMSDADVGSLLSVCARDRVGLRDRAMVELLYATGARISELSGLDVRDVDVAQGQARLLGKGRKERIVPIYPRALEAWRAYLLRARPELCVAGPLDAAFVSTRGRRMSADALRQRFERLVRLAGLDPALTPHAMRHTFATELLDGGADLRCVQELLGHESLSTTQVYTHLTTERLRRAVELAHPRG